MGDNKIKEINLIDTVEFQSTEDKFEVIRLKINELIKILNEN